jgi:uncharacterized membrane protein
MLITTQAPLLSSPHYVERWSGRILRIGVWSSAVLMGSGLLFAVVRSFQDVAPERNPSLNQLVVQLFSTTIEPISLMFAGLVVLMFTPILRVVTAIFGFAAEHDRRFVLVSTVVLAMLLGEVIYSLMR